jgi:hypothetical protein
MNSYRAGRKMHLISLSPKSDLAQNIELYRITISIEKKLTLAQGKSLRKWRAGGRIVLEARDVQSVADALEIPLLL